VCACSGLPTWFFLSYVVAVIASWLTPTKALSGPSVYCDIPRYKLNALFTFQSV